MKPPICANHVRQIVYVCPEKLCQLTVPQDFFDNRMHIAEFFQLRLARGTLSRAGALLIFRHKSECVIEHFPELFRRVEIELHARHFVYAPLDTRKLRMQFFGKLAEVRTVEPYADGLHFFENADEWQFDIRVQTMDAALFELLENVFTRRFEILRFCVRAAVVDDVLRRRIGDVRAQEPERHRRFFQVVVRNLLRRFRVCIAFRRRTPAEKLAHATPERTEAELREEVEYFRDIELLPPAFRRGCEHYRRVAPYSRKHL